MTTIINALWLQLGLYYLINTELPRCPLQLYKVQTNPVIQCFHFHSLVLITVLVILYLHKKHSIPK
jgi:hypothetical protein